MLLLNAGKLEFSGLIWLLDDPQNYLELEKERSDPIGFRLIDLIWNKRERSGPIGSRLVDLSGQWP